MAKKIFTVEADSDDFSSVNELLFAMRGKDMALAISNFKSELRYKFKHRELSDEQHKILEEVYEVMGDAFESVNDCLEAVI